MLSKPEIFNLALAQLYLTKEITDAESDPSKEARTLRLRWPQAWAKVDRKSTRLNSSHSAKSRMPSSA